VGVGVGVRVVGVGGTVDGGWLPGGADEAGTPVGWSSVGGGSVEGGAVVPGLVLDGGTVLVGSVLVVDPSVDGGMVRTLPEGSDVEVASPGTLEEGSPPWSVSCTWSLIPTGRPSEPRATIW
jgi:hypothetical protein